MGTSLTGACKRVFCVHAFGTVMLIALSAEPPGARDTPAPPLTRPGAGGTVGAVSAYGRVT